MFGPRILGTGLSFTKILGGINKTLNVMNQVIPLYKEAKPIMSNARNAFNLIKEMSNTTTKRVTEHTSQNMAPIKEKINLINSTQKGPTFFQ